MRLPAAVGSLLGGEFSTGEMGNFHPALTRKRDCVAKQQIRCRDSRVFTIVEQTFNSIKVCRVPTTGPSRPEAIFKKISLMETTTTIEGCVIFRTTSKCASAEVSAPV
jgi:hypothetical protein